MKLLQVTPYLDRLCGGPFVSVSGLSKELATRGVDVLVSGVSDSFSAADADFWQPATVRIFKGQFLRSYRYAAEFGHQLPIIQPDIVHTHGMWLYPHASSYRYSFRNHVPLIVSPRGMLEPWAFSYKAWKKRPIWWLYERAALQSARVLHATASQEAAGLRSLGLTPPIAVIPNGVDLPGLGGRETSRDGRRMALFLSRIHPVKGVNNLIQAWCTLRPAGWRLVVAGPDEVGIERELRDMVAQAGAGDDIEFAGPVFDTAKSRLLQQAELFVLPTFSENFGVAIAEALAAGLPVITTTGAPWGELESHGCGWWVDIGVEPLVAALRTATGLSQERLACMGEQGRRLVSDRYAWSCVAERMQSVYEWVLHGGGAPDCIEMV